MRIGKLAFVGAVTLAFVLGLAGASALQDGGADAPEKKGDDATPEIKLPDPRKDPILDRLVGRWESENEMYNPATGKWKPMNSKDEWEWVLNGQFLVMEYEAPDAFGPGKAAEGVWFLRPKGEGAYQAWWFDNFGTVETSTGKLEDGKFIFHGKSHWGESRFQFQVNEDGTSETRSELKGPDGQWAIHARGKGKKVG